jgi:hypothetical protein
MSLHTQVGPLIVMCSVLFWFLWLHADVKAEFILSQTKNKENNFEKVCKSSVYGRGLFLIIYS